MRPTTLIPLYLLAPLTLASPIPFVLVQDLEAVSGAARPPTHVPATRPKHALPEIIVFPIKNDDTPIDNRPITPSATAQPSVVLASPRPIATEYLLSLTHHPFMSSRKGGGAGKVVKLPAEAVEAIEDSSMTRMEMGVGDADEAVVLPVAGGRMGMPCYRARLGRGNNDVLAVSLIFIFVAVVVFVETFSSLRRFFSKRGAIRLEAGPSTEKQTPLSVRSDAVAPGEEAGL
ncbi:hypothetical protein GE09DRAFT_1228584 [Coniochaeta sp. 2T2.1]|nr:hypothetical protein GE09DRAFT_1228584 [Coniochaeta sp. 2T2.1]